jgi:large subunit ribosomal protein L19
MATAKKTDKQLLTPDQIKPGMVVRVYLKIKDINTKGEEKERIQIYEGLVIAKKHGIGPSATITVRKTSEGIGVERILPIHSPLIEKVELVDTKQTRKSKLYYTRDYSKRLKSISEKKTK